jgi:hypothetical protein
MLAPARSFFLVSYPSEQHSSVLHTYAVSNWHVVCKDGFSVIRLNTISGGIDIIPLGPEDWEFDPRYDVAVAPIPIKKDVHRYTMIHYNGFITRETAEQVRLGHGEDVFMIGRFIDHDGGPTNRPSVRFGNISILPSPIIQPNGRMADSFCIDLHSRSGYSGSPVFVYRTPGYDLEMEPEKEMKMLLAGVNFFRLLGIQWGQFPEEWEIRAGLTKTAAKEASLITEGNYVKGLSGMTCVLPAWCIAEVMQMPKLKDLRRLIDAAWEEKFRQEGRGVAPDQVSF